MGGWTNPSIAGGGTLSGDLTVTGNLTVQGTTTSIVNQTISGTVIIDVDDTEAFLVRKDGDAADVFIVDTSNDRVGILGAPSAALDIHSGSVALLLGADTGATTRTDATNKIARVAVPHYTNAEEAAAIFFVQTLSGSSLISFGGGNASLNAATELLFFTAANNTTVTGTQRMTIDSAGNVGIGIVAPTSLIHGVATLDDATGNEVAYTLAYTTNKATSGNDTGLLIAMTDTASPGTSRLLDLHVGGATRFFVDLNGLVQFENQVRGANANGPTILDEAASATNPTLIPNLANTTTGIGGASGEVSLITGGVEAIRIDSNQDVGLGIAPVTGCQLLLPSENDAVTPTLAFGAGADTGFYEGAANELRVAVGGTPRWTFLTSNFQANGSSGPLLIDQTSSATTVTVIANRTVTNTGLGGVAGEISLITGGAERIKISDAGLTMGNDALVARDVNAGLTASTTQTQGQGALTAEINEISTVANADDTVTLITASTGLKQTIINNGANQVQIFPASGDDLGSGVDTAVSLAAGSNITYAAYDATNWESV